MDPQQRQEILGVLYKILEDPNSSPAISSAKIEESDRFQDNMRLEQRYRDDKMISNWDHKTRPESRLDFEMINFLSPSVRSEQFSRNTPAYGGNKEK